MSTWKLRVSHRTCPDLSLELLGLSHLRRRRPGIGQLAISRETRVEVASEQVLKRKPLLWNERENSPSAASIMVKAAGVPVDRYASESIELLRDIDARWTAQRSIRDSAAFDKRKDAAVAWLANAPNADIYPVEVSFQVLADKKERDYLNQLPTSFALPAEAVDRLRAAAKNIILASPELQRVLKASGSHVVDEPPKSSARMP
jgi:hypothetical protein